MYINYNSDKIQVYSKKGGLDMKTILKDRFKDKVMIVTGASQGIGKETAIRASEEGAKVVLIDLSLEGKKYQRKLIKMEVLQYL